MGLVVLAKLVVRVDAEASVRVVDLLIVRVRHELILMVMITSALFHVGRRLDRVLGVAFTSLLLVLGCEIKG